MGHSVNDDVGTFLTENLYVHEFDEAVHFLNYQSNHLTMWLGPSDKSKLLSLRVL